MAQSDARSGRGAEAYNALLAGAASELARRLRQAAQSAQSAGPDMVAPGGVPEWVRENTLVSCLDDIRSIERSLTSLLEELGVVAPDGPKRAKKGPGGDS